MGDSFEVPYHVPQQSRRDKLRILSQNHDHQFQVLNPLYDPSNYVLLPNSDHLLACASTSYDHHDEIQVPYRVNLVKGEGSVNFMASNYLPLNPNTNSNSNPFVYTPQSVQVLRDFDNGGGGSSDGQTVVFRPEPLSLELNLQRYGGSNTVVCSTDHNNNNDVINSGGGGVSFRGNSGSSSNYNEVSRCWVPLGPFTGYASILKGSRFLKPAQQLLDDLCDVGYMKVYGDKVLMDGAAAFMEPPVECLSTGVSNFAGDTDYSCADDVGGETRRKKSRLNSMLDEVYRRYKLYYQQMQAVVASFECVAGLGNAAPYANFALKMLSKHFRSLKNAITDHLQFTIKAHDQLGHGKVTVTGLGNNDNAIYGQRPVQNSGFTEHQPVWRPQRGLPERAVTVLRAWLFEHFLHPYPTDTDKIMLAKQTGLSRSQVSNWFINARVRLWKPMVEEIHTLETRLGQKANHREEVSDRSSNYGPLPNSVVSSNLSTSTQRAPQDVLTKRTRNQLPDLSTGNQVPPNLSYSNCLSSNPPLGIGESMASGSSNVSLTLGLQQNNGVGLSEPFQINAARRFGLDPDANGGVYVMASFEGQNRQFGRDVLGGQLLRDFVG